MSTEAYRQAVSEMIQRSEYGPVRVQDGYVVLERHAGRELVDEALTMLDEMGPLVPE
jgi:hypothetical protein